MSIRPPDTPAFKAWFSDSKIRSRGVAKVVFHASPVAGFSAFKRVSGKARGKSSPASIGFHFGTADAASARICACSHSDFSLAMLRDRLGEQIAPAVYPVYLRITNPLRMGDLGSWHDAKRISRWLVRDGVVTQTEADDAVASRRRLIALQDLIKSKGYDGIVYRNTWEGKPADSYVVFDSGQVKSALSNSGAYDGSADDICA